MTYAEMFHALQPGFFDKEYIRTLPEDEVFVEQIIDLHTWQEGEPVPYPEHITFGFYKGDIDKLQAAVREVDDDWAQWFGKTDRVFCAFDGERIASFCLLDAFGEYDGLRVGGPGCVGTIPAYRKLGIGLRMVQLATDDKRVKVQLVNDRAADADDFDVLPEETEAEPDDGNLDTLVLAPKGPFGWGGVLLDIATHHRRGSKRGGVYLVALALWREAIFDACGLE